MDEVMERSIIARIQAGDHGACEALIEEHQGLVMKVARQILRNEETVLDVAQEVFLRAIEELPRWRGEARFSTWLYRAALHVCLERIRAQERQRRYQEQAAVRRASDTPEVLAVARELAVATGNAVTALPPRQRTIFLLRQYEDRRFQVIAEMLGITEGGVKASYHRACSALRKCLKDVAPATS